MTDETQVVTVNHIIEMGKTKYLSAQDLGGAKLTLRIRGVFNEMVDDFSNNTKSREDVLRFVKADGSHLQKGLIINATNRRCLAAMFGATTKAWSGKSVTIYCQPKCFGEKDGIRIYGSPDIPADFTVTIALPRKKPTQMTLYKTGQKTEEKQQ